MIETLQAENADLKKNLGLAGSKQNEVKDQQISSKFEELLSRQSKRNVTNSCNTFIYMYMYAKYCNILILTTLPALPALTQLTTRRAYLRRSKASQRWSARRRQPKLRSASSAKTWAGI